MLPTMQSSERRMTPASRPSAPVPSSLSPVPSRRSSYGRRASINPMRTIPTAKMVSRRGCMIWEQPPESILLIRKLDVDTVGPFIQLASWLLYTKEMTVFVEEKTLSDADFHDVAEKFVPMKSDLKVFKGYEGCQQFTDKIDIIICLGGDGTLLYASSLFEKSIPPIMSFNLGSLGFLTPFGFDKHRETLESLFLGNMQVLMRSRLEARVQIRSGQDHEGETETFRVALNEVTIDRGPSHYLGNLELYINEKLVTQVQGDGLIISTPTGSTAYSLSAGAGMVHPLVPGILITPICPHSLSFRPIVVPSEARVMIRIAPEARHDAYISFDGRSSTELSKTRDLVITTSNHAVPTVAKEDQDWFTTLQELMQWNIRVKQKSLTTNNTIQS